MADDFWTSTMGKIRDLATDATGVEYELHRDAILLREYPLLEKYSEKVRKVLSRNEEPSVLKELWRSDELSRPLFSVLWITDPKFDASRRRIAVETFKIISEDLLGQRYRGLRRLAWVERFLAEDIYLDDEMQIRYERGRIGLLDKDFAAKYPVTHLLLSRLSDIVKKIRSKYGVKIGITTRELLNREGVKYRDPKEFCATITYDVLSHGEDRVKGISERILAIKEFWGEWMKVREEIAHHFGIDDDAFIIRDLLEEALGLPRWSVIVKPANGGWDLMIDVNYAIMNRKGTGEDYWLKISRFVRAEMRKAGAKNFLRIYSLSIPIGLLLEEIVGNASLEKVIEAPKAKRMNIIDYLFNRSNLEEIARNSELLADVLASLIDLIQKSGLKITPIQVYAVWPDTLSELIDTEPISVDNTYYDVCYRPNGYEEIEVSLTTDVEVSGDVVNFVSEVIDVAGRLDEVRKALESFLKWAKQQNLK
ncbi:MAG: hypothetical protein QXU95_03420 [Candidatus Bathyarchaeia archaeon]